MAAFSEEIVEIKCDPHKILNNTYLYRFFCSKFKSFHNGTVVLASSAPLLYPPTYMLYPLYLAIKSKFANECH